MTRAQRALVALLAAATVLFAVGAVAERSRADAHAEPASAQAEDGAESAREPEGAHDRAEPAHADANEAVLGVDVESTPLIVLAVIAGLGVAALAASRLGRLRAVLWAIALVALAWAALDAREAVHQLDESRTGIAVLAIAVAVLHLAAALIAGRGGASAASLP